MVQPRGVLEDDVPSFSDTLVSKRLPGSLSVQSTAEDIARLRKAELKDVDSQLFWRRALLIFACTFLAAQTFYVFRIVDKALFGPTSVDTVALQPLLAMLIAGTLAETYGIFRVMVRFVFSAVNYDAKEDRMGALEKRRHRAGAPDESIVP